MKKTLPAPPAKKNVVENPEGNEETATLEHENDTKMSEDQNEGGEQMDTD